MSHRNSLWPDAPSAHTPSRERERASKKKERGYQEVTELWSICRGISIRKCACTYMQGA